MFNDEAAAFAHFEAIRWPEGPVCPRCGAVNQATLIKGKSHRPGMYQCNACRAPFTVKIGTVMESSHIPMHKWALGFHLMASSKKGMSAHQLHRMLGITYKSAWFMAHRIREAMDDGDNGPVGGEDKTLEIDETYINRGKTKLDDDAPATCITTWPNSTIRYSNRIALGMNDVERTLRAVKGAQGKRLSYNQSRRARAA
jgi:transposase-like protein